MSNPYAVARTLPDLQHKNVLTLRRLTWIEIELVGEDDKPIPNEKYRVLAPDGTLYEGVLDADGLARVEGIVAGMCKVCFPNLNGEAWEDADKGGKQSSGEA